MKQRIIKLQIRQDHIDSASRHPDRCPEARALKERYPGLAWRVGNRKIALRVGKKYVYIGKQGTKARDFVVCFDNRGQRMVGLNMDQLMHYVSPSNNCIAGPLAGVKPCTLTLYGGRGWPDEPETLTAMKHVEKIAGAPLGTHRKRRPQGGDAAGLKEKLGGVLAGTGNRRPKLDAAEKLIQEAMARKRERFEFYKAAIIARQERV